MTLDLENKISHGLNHSDNRVMYVRNYHVINNVITTQNKSGRSNPSWFIPKTLKHWYVLLARLELINLRLEQRHLTGWPGVSVMDWVGRHVWCPRTGDSSGGSIMGGMNFPFPKQTHYIPFDLEIFK